VWVLRNCAGRCRRAGHWDFQSHLTCLLFDGFGLTLFVFFLLLVLPSPSSCFYRCSSSSCSSGPSRCSMLLLLLLDFQPSTGLQLDCASRCSCLVSVGSRRAALSRRFLHRRRRREQQAPVSVPDGAADPVLLRHARHRGLRHCVAAGMATFVHW
jgi:hypothetical protein